MSDDWLPRHALVVGLGRTGEAAALALAERGVAVTAADRSPDAEAGRLLAAGVEVRLGTEEESLLQGIDLVVKGPGVPPHAPPIAAARVPVWSELELGYRLLPPGVRILGVTGTKGKTTTVRMLGAIFAAAGRDFALGGNEHTPLSALEPHRDLVLELSSFALNDVDQFTCDVAVLLNLEPDHLNWHGTFEAYRDAKLRVFDGARVKIAPRGFGVAGAIEFSGDDPLPAEPTIPGAHNRENAAAAVAAARASGIDDDAIARGLSTFEGVPHRLELIRELNGVRYVNDSKATNTSAARRGIAAYGAPLHVILGGSIKGEDFSSFARELAPNVRSIHLIGETASELAAALDAAGRHYSVDGDLPTAVARAQAVAEPGDVVLLSPATASFDQYPNFEARGEHFRRIVEELS